MNGPEVGRRYSFDTIIPAVAEHTNYVDAGAITIGVEYRVVDEDVVMANLRAHGIDRPPPGAQQVIEPDGGVSLHICDAETRDEYLRFDMFATSPHYHYVCPGEYQVNVVYDQTAFGDLRPWALRCIRERLPKMLASCGGADLAARLHRATVEAALPRVEELIDRAAMDS